MSRRSLSIAIWTKYDIRCGSSRERVGNYLPLLKRRGHRVTVRSLIPPSVTDIWMGKRSGFWIFRKAQVAWHSRLKKYIWALRLIFEAKTYDIILIQKIMLPWLLLKWLSFRNRHLIFDFDDICFYDPHLSLAKKVVQWRHALHPISRLRYYKATIAGNQYLQSGIQSAVRRIYHIPTPIDCALYRRKLYSHQNNPVVIGWMGSGEHHLSHLELLIKPLQILGQSYSFCFYLIGTMGSPRIISLFDKNSFRLKQSPWLSAEALAQEIQTFDIGVMPLQSTTNARGKCGFKALAYMACGVPVVISPIGVNCDIIQDGQNGFLAASETEWIEKLGWLIQKPDLRQKIGLAGYKTVRTKYALDRLAPTFIRTIEQNSR